MLSIVQTISLIGLSGKLIEVQTDINGGLPSFEIVGLPDTTVKESKERIKSAIKNSNIDLKSKKILINLAPANTKKEGSSYDLPIAIGILIATEIIKNPKIENTIFIGELALNGKINKVKGILPMCIEAKRLGIKTIYVPKENEKEATITDQIEIIPVQTLKELIYHLNKIKQIPKSEPSKQKTEQKPQTNNPDFSEVKGQENVKRALEISAAGSHNCILTGSPGAGKTMLARRLPTILPDLTFNEALEITKIHSIAGILETETGLITTRPFRTPHHSISSASMIGGGKIPKPGEITLAHYGVLYLDELTEFKKQTLESLREPLEYRQVTISRVSASLTYPCNFMLIASMNPCPCGYYKSNIKKCTCTQKAIKKYREKISGPLLDRIDIQVEVKPVKYQKLQSTQKIESSQEIKKRVNKARKIQQNRYKNETIICNNELTPKLIQKYCKLDKQGKELLKKAFTKLGLTARGYTRILKVARTIADLEEKQNIEAKHIAEAIQYRIY